MPDTVISVENLSKHYPSTALRTSRLGVVSTGSTRRIGSNTLRDDAARWWAKLRGQPDPTLKIGQSANATSPSSVVGGRSSDSIWALRDVSFEVQRGEVVGIPSTGSGQAWSRRPALSLSKGSAGGRGAGGGGCGGSEDVVGRGIM